MVHSYNRLYAAMKINEIQLQGITRVNHWSVILKEEIMKEDMLSNSTGCLKTCRIDYIFVIQL